MRHLPIHPDLFIQNRARLKKLMQPNSLAVVNSNDVLPTNADGHLRMVPNSDLFYLTGIEQEETILFLCPDAPDPKLREILFLREPRKELEVWEGKKLQKEEARELSGIQEIHWLGAFEGIFRRVMCETDNVYLNSNEHPRAHIVVETREARFVRETMERFPLHQYHRLAKLLYQLRPIKSAQEIDLIKHACAITRKAFKRVAKFVKPGVEEFEIEAEFAHEFIRNRAGFAYTPIIASGRNACGLHYISNAETCRDGELLLLDVAASYANYNSDLTRTIPVNGRFSKRQKQVYNAVLRVLKSQIAGLVPGKKWQDWQKESEQAIQKELVDLGLLTTRAIKNQETSSPAVKRYFMHGVGHPIGLDVHDLGLYAQPMAAGWVMTVEPGIYIPEEGFAVRLENDVLITENGPVDLMADIPIEAEEIEELMANKKGKV